MGSSRWKDKQEDKLKKELDLLENGISYKSENLRKLERVPKNIMYHVNQSLPHHSSGYAIRTQALLRSLKRKDWNIEAYTRIGYPNDRYDFTGVRTVNSRSNVDGITYNFVPSRKKGIGKLNIQDYQNESVKLIIEQAPIKLESLVDSPCLTCPVEQKCDFENAYPEPSPLHCQLIENWVAVEFKKKK